MKDDVKKARESGFIAHLTKPIVVRRLRATIGEMTPDVLTIHEVLPDQRYGRGDLARRLHQLKYYLRAVVNAILDRKMHVESMIDDEAMALLVGRAFQTEGKAVGKVSRSQQ